MDLTLIIELEVDVLDKKRPDFVTEAVCIQMTLCKPYRQHHLPQRTSHEPRTGYNHLER
jgi:hypothetical protein